MTHFSDMPAALAQGTLTCCNLCGRIAVFAEFKVPPNATMDDDGQNPVECDTWRCGCCGRLNDVPIRDNRTQGRTP